MFKALDGRKRRIISARTVIASVTAHVLLLGGAVYAAASDTAPREVVGSELILPPLPVEPAPEPIDPVEPAPPPPPAAPSAPDAPAPVFGTRLELPAPVDVPAGIIDEPPGVQPVRIEDHRGIGPAGDQIGTPPVVSTPPSGGTAVEPYIPDESMVEVRPELNRGGLARTMERYYPPALRDSRVTGTVLIEVVVGEDGRVRPNSARVVEASHPAFGQAAIRAAERFRFSPAKIGNVAVPVRVVIPISWTLPD